MLSRALKEHTANQSAIKEKQGNYNSEIILRTDCFTYQIF